MRGPLQTKGPVKTEAQKDEDREYSFEEIDEATNVLIKAKEIEENNPTLFDLCKKAMSKKEHAINQIRSMDDLRAVANGQKKLEEPVENNVEDDKKDDESEEE